MLKKSRDYCKHILGYNFIIFILVDFFIVFFSTCFFFNNVIHFLSFLVQNQNSRGLTFQKNSIRLNKISRSSKSGILKFNFWFTNTYNYLHYLMNLSDFTYKFMCYLILCKTVTERNSTKKCNWILYEKNQLFYFWFTFIVNQCRQFLYVFFKKA